MSDLHPSPDSLSGVMIMKDGRLPCEAENRRFGLLAVLGGSVPPKGRKLTAAERSALLALGCILPRGELWVGKATPRGHHLDLRDPAPGDPRRVRGVGLRLVAKTR